jgi:hypothetical protein
MVMSVTINPITQDIQLTRGESFSFTPRDKLTTPILPYVFTSVDRLTITVKKSVASETLFTRTCSPVGTEITIPILPVDTLEASFGIYYYDIEWTKTDDPTFSKTLIPIVGRTEILPKFEICKEMTTHESQS